MTSRPAKFLGFIIKAALPRNIPGKSKSQNIVGKPYPDMNKIKAKVKSICQEIKKLRYWEGQLEKAVQIEKVNAMITGVTEYHKSAICSSAFSYIDDKINKSAYATFKAMYGKHYKEYCVPLTSLANRPGRHQGYQTKTFAIKYNEMQIGITRAFLTHSQWEKYPFNQCITPYTEQGRKLYLKQFKRKKTFPLDRPPLYDIRTLEVTKKVELNNFEFYMNREYAYNRDRGKCKLCGELLVITNRHCHRIHERLPLDKINKVPNLVWMCTTCDEYIHGNEIPRNLDKKIIGKIRTYQVKLG